MKYFWTYRQMFNRTVEIACFRLSRGMKNTAWYKREFRKRRWTRAFSFSNLRSYREPGVFTQVAAARLLILVSIDRFNAIIFVWDLRRRFRIEICNFCAAQTKRTRVTRRNRARSNILNDCP